MFTVELYYNPWKGDGYLLSKEFTVYEDANKFADVLRTRYSSDYTVTLVQHYFSDTCTGTEEHEDVSL